MCRQNIVSMSVIAGTAQRRRHTHTSGHPGRGPGDQALFQRLQGHMVHLRPKHIVPLSSADLEMVHQSRTWASLTWGTPLGPLTTGSPTGYFLIFQLHCKLAQHKTCSLCVHTAPSPISSCCCCKPPAAPLTAALQDYIWTARAFGLCSINSGSHTVLLGRNLWNQLVYTWNHSSFGTGFHPWLLADALYSILNLFSH